MSLTSRLLLVLALTLGLALPAFAQTVPVNPCEDLAEATRGKSSQAIDVILQSCRKGSENSIVKVPDAEEFSEWAQASKGFAEALGIAAKELGIAVNDFLASPAGILLAFILLLNYAGGAVIGLPFTIFTLILLWTLVRRLSIASIEYETVPVFWGFTTVRRKKVTKFTSIDDDNALILTVATIVMVILNLIVWLNV